MLRQSTAVSHQGKLCIGLAHQAVLQTACAVLRHQQVKFHLPLEHHHDVAAAEQEVAHPIMKVIDDGALRRFVPVDRTWSGFSSEDFKVASQSVYGGEESNDTLME